MIKFPDHIKDSNGYLFFSANTRGQSGNPIKIHADLFIDFFCNVDPSTHDGQAVIREIESLRAFGKLAGTPAQAPRKVVGSDRHKNILEKLYKTQDHMRSYQSLARERSIRTKNVHAFFQIDQKSGDKYPTVYISEVQILHSGKDNLGGLYEFKRMLTGNQLSKSEGTNLDGKDVFVSRATESLDEAVTSAKILLNDQKIPPAIFYNPMSVANDLSFGKEKRLSESTNALVKELSNLINQNHKSKVRWHIEGEGAALLRKAIAQYNGSLENHSFRLINARTDLTSLLNSLGQKRAKLEGDFIHYSGDRVALLAIANKAEELTKKVKSLPTSEGYDKVSRRYLVKYLGTLGANGQAKGVANHAISARGSMRSFIDILENALRGFK